MNNIRAFDTEIEAIAVSALRKAYCDEIERAVANVKRTAWDKWWRRQWYRTAAQRRRYVNLALAHLAEQRSWRR